MALSTNLISGLSSGFDWRSMIDQLIAVEHRGVDMAENQKTAYSDQLTQWQSFNSNLLTLQSASRDLKETDSFKQFSSTLSSDNATVKAEDLLSVSTNTEASLGSYTVKVVTLAAAQKLSSNPFTSLTDSFGSAYEGDLIING